MFELFSFFALGVVLFVMGCLAFDLYYFNSFYVIDRPKHPEIYLRKTCFGLDGIEYFRYRQITFSSGKKYSSAELPEYWYEYPSSVSFRKLGFFEARRLYKSQEKNQAKIEHILKQGFESAVV